MDPAAYAALQQQQAAYPTQAYLSATAQYGPQGPTPYPAQAQQALPAESPVGSHVQHQIPPQAAIQQQPVHVAQQQQQQQLPTQIQAQPQTQLQTQTQPQPQVQLQPQVQPQAQVQSQAQSQPQVTQGQQAAQVQSGPPYVFDPNGVYADPNVQAWATYYASGGTDTAGAVYFLSVPGVTDQIAPAGGSIPDTNSQQQQQQPHQVQTAPQQQQAQQLQQQRQEYQQQVQQNQIQQQQPSSGPQVQTQGPGQAGVAQPMQTDLGGFGVQQSQPLPLNTQATPLMNGFTTNVPTSPYTSISTNPWAQSSASPPGSPNQPQAVPTNIYPQQANPDSPPRATYPNQSISAVQPSAQSPQSQMTPPYMSTGAIADPIAQPVPTQPVSLRRAMSLTGTSAAEPNPSGYSQYYSIPNQIAAISIGEDGSQAPHAGQPQQSVLHSSHGVGAPA